ncbi:MAG: AtpZ/AtpI family protein [Bacillota bacterium]
MKKNDNKSAVYIFNMVVQFFFETFVAMVIGYFLGQWLDKMLFEEKVIFTYILVVIGIFAGLRNLVIRALKYDKGESHEE